MRPGYVARVVIAAITAPIGLCGCDTRPTGSPSPEVRIAKIPDTRDSWLKNWEVSIDAERMSPRREERVKQLMSKIRDAEQRVELQLLDVTYGCDQDDSSCSIIVYPYDETGSLVGICVYEYDSDGALRLKEDYHLYLAGFQAVPSGLAYTIPFTPREAGQVKDEALWGEYVERGVESKEMRPPVLVSLPDQDRHVFVSLLRSDGTETEMLEIQEWEWSY